MHLDVPADADHFTWTVAKPGYVPVRTFYRATIAEVRARIESEGELFSIMEPAPEPISAPDTVEVTVNSMVPFCISAYWEGKCRDAGALTTTLPQASQPMDLIAYSTDAQNCPVELKVLTLSDTLTDQTVELVFDGSHPGVAKSFEARVQLPSDPASVLITEGVNLITEPSDSLSRWPFVVFDFENRLWGGSCNKRLDAAAGVIDLTVSYLPRDDRDLIFAFGLWPGEGTGSELSGATEHWLGLASPVPGTYQVLDIPVLATPIGGATRSSTFSSQPISGATRYAVEVSHHTPTYHSLWVAQSWRHQDIVLPALPAGYDAAAEWGFRSGYYRAIASAGWDQHFVTARAAVLSKYPEWTCGYSEPVAGQILE